MPEEDCGTGKMEKSKKVLWMKFISDDEAAEVLQPSEKPFDLPSAFVTTKFAAILLRTLSFSPSAVGGDDFCAELFGKSPIQRVAVIGLVADQSLRDLFDEARFHCQLGQSHFSRRSACRANGERKTMAVCDCHDLAAFAPFGLPDQEPSFFGGSETAVDETFSQIKFPPVLQILSDSQEHILHDA